ncbi:MAG: GTPase Era [Anaerolineae bacterium]|nr:GTPase Era [Anaerolineae bacterium]
MSEQETEQTDNNDEQTTAYKSGFVAFVGRPNVGKSTLFNAFMQQKLAIVSPRPQTTRTRMMGIITDPGYQMIFLDTPGLIKPRHKLDEFMVETAVSTLEDADVIVYLVDASEPPGAGDRAIARQLAPIASHTKIILAMNKGDLLAFETILPRTAEYRELMPQAEDWILFSASEGNGRDELFQMLEDALPIGPQYYPEDQLTDVFIKDIAGELIREQIFLQLRDEIPYGTAVVVQEFKERENGVTYINANIFIERDTHKRIIIGSNGKQLQQIGQAARKEIEELIDGKVFLDLFVKVEPKWRRNEQALKRLGYTTEKS